MTEKGTNTMKRKLICLILVLTLVGMLTACGLTVPRPEIREGRFNFSITYAIGDEVKTLSAVYVCEFDGTSWAIEGCDYSRDWKDYVEGDYEGDTYSAIVGTTDDGGDIGLFFGIYPEYFMGDFTADRGAPEPFVYVSYPENENGEMLYFGDPKEVEELYGAKIISYEYDEPVENRFVMFKYK